MLSPKSSGPIHGTLSRNPLAFDCRVGLDSSHATKLAHRREARAFTPRHIWVPFDGCHRCEPSEVALALAASSLVRPKQSRTTIGDRAVRRAAALGELSGVRTVAGVGVTIWRTAGERPSTGSTAPLPFAEWGD